MRLIDIDKLVSDYKGKNKSLHNVTWFELSDYEVKAIPVEWLLKRAELCTIDYANCLHYSVEAWQTEQKCMVNGRWKFPKDGEKENGN